MLRKHFAMSGDNKPDFIITYHAPQHVPFFGGYSKNWVYGYPDYGSGAVIDENLIKFKVIGDKWADGVGEWKFRLEDSSNKIYNSTIIRKKVDNLDDGLPSNTGFGHAEVYIRTDENGNIASEGYVDNTNIITSVIFGEGIETINGSILVTMGTEDLQSSCTDITLPESVALLTGYLFDIYASLKSITVPHNVIRIDNLCSIDGGILEEVILKPLTPPDASNASQQIPLGSYSSNVKDSLKIRTYADAINNYKNDSIWGQYSDLYDTINDTIVYYNNGGRELYTENQDITSINLGTLPQSITNVYLPNSVTSIGDSAFSNCTGLTSITIPNLIKSIGLSAFSNCSKLTSVVWNAINHPDFSDSSSNPFYIIRNQITSFEFGDSVEHIPAYMCYEMSNLTSVTIPNSVAYIRDSAFEGCSSLTSIIIPNSVRTIGLYVFKGCSGLTSVVWNAINCLDFNYFNNPFYNIRTQITSFEFGDSVEYIPAYVCYRMSNLTSVVIPNSVTSIGESAFYGTPWLNKQPDGCIYINNILYVYKGEMPENTHIDVREGTISISDRAFEGCSRLTSITIPDSVNSIGNNAFYNCSALTSIVIPNLITNIGMYAFYNCSALTSIVIPNLITNIGMYAFSECSSLTSITMSPIVPPSLGSSVFSGTLSNLQIYVPDESVDAYKTATNWSSYADKIKPISEKPA